PPPPPTAPTPPRPRSSPPPPPPPPPPAKHREGPGLPRPRAGPRPRPRRARAPPRHARDAPPHEAAQRGHGPLDRHGGLLRDLAPHRVPGPHVRGGRHPALLRPQPPLRGRALLHAGAHERAPSLPAGPRRPGPRPRPRGLPRPPPRHLPLQGAVREAVARRDLRPAVGAAARGRGVPMSWAETYRRRITTPEEALRAVRSGDHVWIHA